MHQMTQDPAPYAASVVAVPPIALTAQGDVARAANARLMAHIAAGGVQTLLYGGNANLYHFNQSQVRTALTTLIEDCPDTARILFSIGPGFGQASDQADEIRRVGCRHVMLLPTAFPSDPSGVANGVRRIADRLGFGLVLYIKRQDYIAPEALARLVQDGSVAFVKYAVERDDASEDAYLDRILQAVGADLVASGMGETPISDHIGQRGLATFTSGAVCIAPAACNRLLTLYRSGQHDDADRLSQPFLEFERLRMRFGGIQLLHDAVGMAGLGDFGPMLPMMSNLDAEARTAIAPVVTELVRAEEAARADA